MFFRFGSLFLMIASALPLVSARYRAFSGGPIPIGFMSNAAVRRGYRRGRNYFYLSVFFMSAFGFLFSFKPTAPTWKIVEMIFIASWLMLILLFLTQVMLNWPKVWIDTEMREDEGSLVIWWRQKVRRSQRRPSTSERKSSHGSQDHRG